MVAKRGSSAKQIEVIIGESPFSIERPTFWRQLRIETLTPWSRRAVGMATADDESFPRVVRGSRVIGSQVPADSPGDLRRGVLDRFSQPRLIFVKPVTGF